MKLTVKCVRGQGARLCSLTEVGRHGNKTLETPTCLMYTRGGSAPHLSADLLSKIKSVPSAVHMPINLLAEHVEGIAGFKEGIAKFAALGDKLVYTSCHDPAVEVREGSNDKTGMGIWGKSGRTKLDSDSFVKLQEALLPDWFQAMSDADTDKSSSRKRAQKAVARTLTFLDQIQEKLGQCDRLKYSQLFGSIAGGFDLRERERCARETVARNCDGYVIEGFHRNGPLTENFDAEKEAGEIIRAVLKVLPEDKPRVMHGVWRPDKLLEAVELGIDVFDSSYPYVATDRGEALKFNYQYKDTPESTLDGKTPLTPGFTMKLSDKQYIDDFTPLLEDCSCYTCQNFTRAYVNHLLNTSELLANILLMIHNFEHYFRFFKTIREALAENKFEDLKHQIQQQAPAEQTEPIKEQQKLSKEQTHS